MLSVLVTLRLTALLKEERLLVTVDAQKRGAFQLDPYTLLVYKKGLYLAGWSDAHQAIRTFALDGFKDVEWLKGNKFEYPADYQPEKLYEGAFGLIRGEPVKVKIRFSEKVARYVRRRRWHPTQRVRNVAGGVELTMEVRGTTEIVSWVLGFGQEAEIVEPAELREAVRGELTRALASYP
jgi:proteasome accessory factor B